MKSELSQLTPSELLLLQKHLKLGKKHLLRRLNDEEISYLFGLEKIDLQTQKKLGVYAPEFLGNMSLALNSIFTAILGTWSGMSGLLKFKLSLPIFFSLLAFCTLIGGWIGFNHYKLIKKTTDDALEKEKSRVVEIQILKILNHQRKAEINRKIVEINEILQCLKIEGIELLDSLNHQLNDYEICLNWLNQTEKALKELHSDELSTDVFFAEIEKTKTLLQEQLLENSKRKEGAVVEILRKLGAAPIQPHVSIQNWLKSNFRNLIVSLTPVIFGGFSSLFVYLGGAPKLAEETGLSNLASFLGNPEVKYIELAIAACITVYFSLAFLYVNHHAFKRDQELAKTEVLLDREETKLDLLDDKLLKIKQIAEFMKPLENVYSVLKKLTQETVDSHS
jgi:hypothetical protein